MIANIFFVAVLGGLAGSIALFIVNSKCSGSEATPEEKKQKMRLGVFAALAWLSVLLMYGSHGIKNVAGALSDIGNIYDSWMYGLLAGVNGFKLGVMMFMLYSPALICTFALMAVAVYFLPRLSLKWSKIFAGVTGILSIITVILMTFGASAEAPALSAVAASLLFAAGIVLVVLATCAAIPVVRTAFHRPQILLYIIPALMYLHGMIRFISFIFSAEYFGNIGSAILDWLLDTTIAMAILILALRNKPAVKWWGLTNVTLTIIGIIISALAGHFIHTFTTVLPLLLLATITGIDIMKWLKAGNTLQWKTPELYRNPVFLTVAAVVIASVIFYIL